MNIKEVTADILIPVYKPGRELYELLSRLLKQTFPIHEIIIMNTEREYWKEEIYLPLFEGEKGEPLSTTTLKVCHLTKPEFDHGKTRHQGLMESGADVVVCMTQDAVPKDRHLIENLIKALLADDQIAASYARQLPAAGCSVVEQYTRTFNYPEESRIKSRADLDTLGIKTYFCSNVCAAYRKELYVELEGFTRKTIFNEDMIYAAKVVKAGYKIAYAADARVIHSHNYRAIEQLHRNFDMAVSQADHPEVFEGVPAEGEGLRLVKKTAGYLLKSGRWYLLPDLIIKSGFKYIGYRLGKAYKKLPKALILRLTMDQAYWK